MAATVRLGGDESGRGRGPQTPGSREGCQRGDQAHAGRHDGGVRGSLRRRPCGAGCGDSALSDRRRGRRGAHHDLQDRVRGHSPVDTCQHPHDTAIVSRVSDPLTSFVKKNPVLAIDLAEEREHGAVPHKEVPCSLPAPARPRAWASPTPPSPVSRRWSGSRSCAPTWTPPSPAPQTSMPHATTTTKEVAA